MPNNVLSSFVILIMLFMYLTLQDEAVFLLFRGQQRCMLCVAPLALF